MGVNDISRSFGHGVGKLVGTTRKVLSWPGNTLGNVVEKFRSVRPNAGVRAIVTEELIRLLGTEELVQEKLEQRLKVMAQTIIALQERLDKLAAGGHITQAEMLDTVNSVKSADSLTSDERIILVNVFRQNVAIQKPELVAAEAD